MTATRIALAFLASAALFTSDAAAQGLDGTWRGTTSGTPSGGSCRPFTFEVTIRGNDVRGFATTPHTGAPVRWSVIGLVETQRVTLFAESGDQRLRNAKTRWGDQLRDGVLHLEQVGSRACNPTRAGVLRKS
jgi:hypothetical protein